MEKNFEKLEVGRRYENKLGEVVKIRKNNNYIYPYTDGQTLSYTPEGRVLNDEPSEYDLVKLLPEEPTTRLAELEAKRAELDKEIEELKKNTQTLYCEAFLYNFGSEIVLDISRTEKERERKIEESAEDEAAPTITTFDLPFRKVNGKWEAAFEIIPK